MGEAAASANGGPRNGGVPLDLDSATVGHPGQPGVCVYCCKRAATDRDHVPPKALLKGVRGDRITVPSCASCNRGASLDDEYLRLTLSADVGAHAHPAADPAWESAFRGLQRKEAMGFKRAFYEATRVMHAIDEQGEALGPVLTYQATAHRQGRVAARIVRGLYYHHTGRVLPDHHAVAWPFKFLVQRERGEKRLLDMGRRMASFAAQNTGYSTGDAVLRYWCHPIENYLAWWLVFFGGMPFLGLAFPRFPGAALPPWVRAFEFP